MNVCPNILGVYYYSTLFLKSLLEVAIAAPYEDDGAGAVYIYTGRALYNEADRYKRRIKPNKYRAFGLSLSAVWDYDDNGSNGVYNYF